MIESTSRNNLDLALIGNSSFSALIDDRARIVWACLPRFDSDPVFDGLLRDGDETDGVFAVDLLHLARTEPSYLRNTAILKTVLVDRQDAAVEVVDFAPRFKQYGRMFRPLTIVRQIRPLRGSPRIRIRIRPTSIGGGAPEAMSYGSNHIRYESSETRLRLTTDASVTALLDQTAFVLERPITLILGPDQTLQGGVPETGRRFFDETAAYWHDWVRNLSIPFDWQEAVIRAAITLKLNAYDDTGAIVAAMTTSIPEAADSGRNWDYRYCWLRDAQFVVGALNRLGTTQTMERYIRYIVNLVAASDGSRLQPVYGINGRPRLEERVVSELPGYRRMGPVRIGNQAYEQVQNDVYGAAVLTATHMFFDERLSSPGDEALFRRLEHLGDLAVQVFETPDAGPWELRASKRIHTYSAVMCWAACDRLSKIARQLGLEEPASHWQLRAAGMHEVISKRAFNTKVGSFVASFDGDDLDATLLLMPELGFLSPSHPRFESTVTMIEKRLRRDDFLLRYATPDDFGLPETAFTVCSFWFVDALHALGRDEEARALFEKLLSHRNRHGLLSEDLDPVTGELWGNFPQTYSMVGIINSARKLSRSWDSC